MSLRHPERAIHRLQLCMEFDPPAASVTVKQLTSSQVCMLGSHAEAPLC